MVAGHHQVSVTYCDSVNSSRPSCLPSRPIPLCFMPPKGAAVHADLKHSALAHLSLRIFNANAAWLVLVVIAFNLTRAAGTAEAPELARATAATLRRKLISVGRTVYGTEATVADMSITTAVVCRVLLGIPPPGMVLASLRGVGHCRGGCQVSELIDARPD